MRFFRRFFVFPAVYAACVLRGADRAGGARDKELRGSGIRGARVMTYDSRSLSALTYSDGFTHWHYKTPDAWQQ